MSRDRTVTSAQTLLRMLSHPSCLIDATGAVLAANPAWTELHPPADESRSDKSGTAWLSVVESADRPTMAAALTAVIADGVRRDVECRMHTADGPRWFLVGVFGYQDSTANTPDSANAPDSWVCSAVDVHAATIRRLTLDEQAVTQQAMLNLAEDCFKLIALDGTLVHMNRAGCVALGVPTDSRFGMPWLPLLPDDVREAGAQALAAAHAGRIGRFAGRSEVPGQRTQHWDNMLTPALDSHGRPTAVYCVSRDVTAEVENQHSLLASEERLAMAIHVSGLGVWDLDIAGGNTLRCDANWHNIMGRDPAEPVTSVDDFRPMIHPDDVDRAIEIDNIAAELVRTVRDYAIEFRIIRPTGEVRWIRSAARFQHEDGVAVRAIGFIRDITEERRAESALRTANVALRREKDTLAQQSLSDPLTGIPNRRSLDIALGQLARRDFPAGQPVCVGLIDIDAFKSYNDRYGHPDGDAALRRIAGALQSVIAPSDLLARYGGEEFAFILRGTADPERVLQGFLDAVAELQITHRGSPTSILTVSCGATAVVSNALLSPTAMVRRADAALYAAKTGGRNRFVLDAIAPAPGPNTTDPCAVGESR